MPYRVALLAVFLAAPAMAQAPQEREPTTVEAERIEGVGDLEVSATGNAEIRSGDAVIVGEELRYNLELGRAAGEGGVRLHRGADRFFGERLRYNTFDDTGVFERPTFITGVERRARGSADRLEFLGERHYRFTNASYTTCRPGQDDWVLEASELDLDYNTEDGRAEGVRLRFFDIPIL